MTSIELSRQFLKEGQNYGYDPSLRKAFYLELVSSLYIEDCFESWGKLLGPPLSSSHTLTKF